MADSADYEYVLYVDEAGDDGLRRVKPIDENGGSEWLCISGVLVRRENEPKTVDWVKGLREATRSSQGPVLHYRNLSDAKRVILAKELQEIPVVLFSVCSNKKNMRSHVNERAAKRGGKQWFYNYCVRILMERVTELCHRDSFKRHKEPKCLKVVFSERGGHSYGQTKAYWELLKRQAAAGSTYLQKRQIRHEVLRYNLVEYFPHTQVAGLQLADIVASAFFQACDTLGSRWNPEPAKQLRGKMHRENSVIADNGVVLQPSPPDKAMLTVQQQEIFSFYGYEFSSVGPGS